MNRLYEIKESNPTLTEIVCMYITNRDEYYQASGKGDVLIPALRRHIGVSGKAFAEAKAVLPVFVEGQAPRDASVNAYGDTIYTDKVDNAAIAAGVNLANGSHPFVKAYQEILKKYQAYSPNVLDTISEEEYAQLLSTINFKYSKLANVLTALRYIPIDQSELNVPENVVVGKLSKCLEVYPTGEPTNKYYTTLEDFDELFRSERLTSEFESISKYARKEPING